MKHFIGRKKELQLLEAEYQKSHSFVFLYGHYQMGKTELLLQFAQQKDALYFLATEEIDKFNVQRFSDSIDEHCNDYQKPLFALSWRDCFVRYARYETGKKKVLILDEFTNLVKGNPDFLSDLLRSINGIFRSRNVMVVLSSSLVGMSKRLLLEDNGMEKLLTQKLYLSPLRFTEVREAYNQRFSEAVEKYAVTDGIPGYADCFSDRLPLFHKIREVLLEKDGILCQQAELMLEKEIREPLNYYSILRIIAAGNHRLGDMKLALDMPSGKLMPYLSALIDLGFVEKQIPLLDKDPENSRKSLYFIANHFLRFWFCYVKPYENQLAQGRTQNALEFLREDFIESYLHQIYTQVCADVFLKLCEENRFPFHCDEMGAHWTDTADHQMILLNPVIIDKQNQQILIGECCYQESPVSPEVYYRLLEKCEQTVDLSSSQYPTYRLCFALFSKSGFDRRLIDIALHNERLWLINELYSVL